MHRDRTLYSLLHVLPPLLHVLLGLRFIRVGSRFEAMCSILRLICLWQTHLALDAILLSELSPLATGLLSTAVARCPDSRQHDFAQLHFWLQRAFRSISRVSRFTQRAELLSVDSALFTLRFLTTPPKHREGLSVSSPVCSVSWLRAAPSVTGSQNTAWMPGCSPLSRPSETV